MDHDLVDMDIGQVENAAEHVPFVLYDLSFLGAQGDRAADLLARRRDLGRPRARANNLRVAPTTRFKARVIGEKNATRIRMTGATPNATRSALDRA